MRKRRRKERKRAADTPREEWRNRMTNYQKTLLAGVAALAIAAGTSFASAQSPHGAAAGGGMAGGGMSSGNSGSGEQSPATQAAPSTPSKGSGMSQHPGTGMQHGGTGSGSTGAGMRPQAEEHPGATEQKGQEKGQGGAKRSAQGAGGGKPSTANPEHPLARAKRRRLITARRVKERHRNGRPRRGPSKRRHT